MAQERSTLGASHAALVSEAEVRTKLLANVTAKARDLALSSDIGVAQGHTVCLPTPCTSHQVHCG